MRLVHLFFFSEVSSWPFLNLAEETRSRIFEISHRPRMERYILYEWGGVTREQVPLHLSYEWSRHKWSWPGARSVNQSKRWSTGKNNVHATQCLLLIRKHPCPDTPFILVSYMSMYLLVDAQQERYPTFVFWNYCAHEHLGVVSVSSCSCALDSAAAATAYLRCKLGPTAD